jgi:hypothetical protein
MKRGISTGVASEREHLEVLIELRPDGSRERVTSWLEQHGLTALPMVAGILATGDADTFAAALGADPRDAVRVPEELSEHVASITPLPPRHMHP